MTDEERELALHRRKERQRTRERRIRDDALSLLVDLYGGPNKDKNPYLPPPANDAVAFGATLLTERALGTQYELGKSDAAIEAGHRVLAWVREQLEQRADLAEALDSLEVARLVFEPEDRESEALFELRCEGAALTYALHDAAVRRVRAAHKRIGVLLDEIHTLQRPKRKRSRRPAAEAGPEGNSSD